MSTGKYSPTVTSSYMRDQSWHKRHCEDSWFDHEGFDSYGYGPDDLDRAGHSEMDYLNDSVLYDDVARNWSGRLLGDLMEYRRIEAGNYFEFVKYKTFRHFISGYSLFVHNDDLGAFAETNKWWIEYIPNWNTPN